MPKKNTHSNLLTYLGPGRPLKERPSRRSYAEIHPKLPGGWRSSRPSGVVTPIGVYT